jgi:hypothetical protein
LRCGAQAEKIYSLLQHPDNNMKKYLFILFSIIFIPYGRAQDTIKPDLPVKFSALAGIPLNISGYVQLRYLAQKEINKPDGLDIRRARLDLKGTINPHWDYRLQLDFASSPKILDAIVTYTHKDWLKFSAGQFKVPLSLENNTPSNNLISIDRSQAVEALVARSKDVIGSQNGRDPGFRIAGSFLKKRERYLFDYSIGIFNGAGINTTDNNEAKDVCGRVVIHPAKNLDIGGAYYNGWAKYGSPSKSKTRNRFGTELAYTWKFLSVQGEFLQGVDDTITRNGWYAQLAGFIYKKNIQLVAKYDTYHPDTEMKNNSTTNYIFGVNIFFNPNVKLQAFYTLRDEEGTEINNDLIGLQLQAGF